MLLLAFAMLSQRRILSLVKLFVLQGLVLTASTLIVGYTTGYVSLYVSAFVTFFVKVIILPWILYSLINRLNIRWDVETLINIPATMLIGIALVIFAFNLAQPFRSSRARSRALPWG